MCSIDLFKRMHQQSGIIENYTYKKEKKISAKSEKDMKFIRYVFDTLDITNK